MKYRLFIWIMWPSFLVSILAEGLLFSVVHPAELLFFGYHPNISDEGIYTIGFFVIWIALTVLAIDLARSGSTSNNGVTELD